MLENSTDRKLERNSSFELLRLIAITFVFLHHTLIRLNLIVYGGSTEHENVIALCLNSIFIIAVDVFFLISGYFNIRLSISKILRLLLLLLLINMLPLVFVSDFNGVKDVLKKATSLYTNNSFVPCYIALSLFSPLLNKALNAFSVIELKKIVLLTAIISVFMGFTLNYSFIDNNGYFLVNYIFIYIVGFTLGKIDKSNLKIYILIVAYLLILSLDMVWAVFYKSGYSAYSYNNPLIVLCAGLFFLIFTKIKIKNNKYINTISKCVFSVFLIEDFVTVNLFNPEQYDTTQIFFKYILLRYFVMICLGYLITIIADKLFSCIAQNRFLKMLDQYFSFK